MTAPIPLGAIRSGLVYIARAGVLGEPARAWFVGASATLTPIARAWPARNRIPRLLIVAAPC